MKNLDLSVFSQNTWEVTLPNKEVIHVNKPTQRKLIDLGELTKKLERTKDTAKQLEILTNTTLFILNNNVANVAFTREQLEEMLNLDMYYAIYFGYMEFVKEITHNPN